MGRIRHIWVCALLFCGSAADAIDWEIEPSVAVAETYTDNLNLSPNSAKESERVTELLPAIRIEAAAKAFEVNLDYRLQGLRYAENDELNENLTYARAEGMAKLIGKSLFVDFSGAINQQIIDPEGATPISGISRGGRAEAKQFSIRPFWQRDFGSGGKINIGYRFGGIEYEELPDASSENSGILATISGAPPRSPWSWVLNAQESNIEYDSGTAFDMQRVGGELAWSITGDTSVFVGAGDQNNEFSNPAPGLAKIDGAYWNLGFRGKLDRQTTYSLSVGEEHYGDSYGFELTRDAGRLKTAISYTEGTTTAGQQRLDYELLLQYLTDVTGYELPGIEATAYVRKRFTAFADLELARGSLRVDYYDEGRDYLTAAEQTEDGIAGAKLSWSWTGLKKTLLTLGLSWQTYDDLPTDDFYLILEGRRDFKYGMFVRLRAWRNNRTGAASEIEYTVNGVSIGLGKGF